jgi:hypothetical protein
VCAIACMGTLSCQAVLSTALRILFVVLCLLSGGAVSFQAVLIISISSLLDGARSPCQKCSVSALPERCSVFRCIGAISRFLVGTLSAGEQGSISAPVGQSAVSLSGSALSGVMLSGGALVPISRSCRTLLCLPNC